MPARPIQEAFAVQCNKASDIFSICDVISDKKMLAEDDNHFI